MGSSVDDLQLAMSILSNDQIHLGDPEIPPLGWRWNETKAKLADKSKVKIGMLTPSPLMTISKATKRALQQTE